jgi:hypothetical protein
MLSHILSTPYSAAGTTVTALVCGGGVVVGSKIPVRPKVGPIIATI